MSSYIKSKFNNKSIKLTYYLAILPLLIYSIYKNGILLYQKELISFIKIFKPLFLIALILFEYVVLKILFKRKEISVKDEILNSYEDIYTILFILITPSTANSIYIAIIASILLILLNIKKIPINLVSISRLLLALIIYKFASYTYMNLYELKVETSYSSLDLLFGKATSSIGTSNIFLCVISYLILCSIKSYKRNIPLYTITIFIGLCFLGALFNLDVKESLKMIFSNEIFFASIFIATIPNYSPITEKNELIYSILIAVLSFVLCLKYLNEGVYIAIIISNILILGFEFINKKHLTNKIKE